MATTPALARRVAEQVPLFVNPKLPERPASLCFSLRTHSSQPPVPSPWPRRARRRERTNTQRASSGGGFAGCDETPPASATTNIRAQGGRSRQSPVASRRPMADGRGGAGPRDPRRHGACCRRVTPGSGVVAQRRSHLRSLCPARLRSDGTLLESQRGGFDSEGPTKPGVNTGGCAFSSTHPAQISTAPVGSQSYPGGPSKLPASVAGPRSAEGYVTGRRAGRSCLSDPGVAASRP